jgi:hypothetical protein
MARGIADLIAAVKGDAPWAERLGRRLAVIVPYRDRAESLGKFIPHMAKYFARDKVDSALEYDLFIVEQAAGKPFNRGTMLNVGFVLARTDYDYFCFHDVDYLPLWADYSYAVQPTRLIWHGLRLVEDRSTFFGGVTMFNRAHFETVNGYSNHYWGWGYEDTDLRLRCELEGLAIEHRDGTYTHIPHADLSRDASGRRTEDVRLRREQFHDQAARMRADGLHRTDGLTSLAYRVLSKRTHPILGVPTKARVLHSVVEI